MRQRMPRQEGGARRSYYTGADRAIEMAIEHESARYNITKSMVIRNALAFTFGIDLYVYETKKFTVKKPRVKAK